MSVLPVDLYQATQVRAMDRRVMDIHGIPGFCLMERAAAAAWRQLRDSWPHAGKVTVVCGSGNNAGDGYLLAGMALDEGCSVQLITVSDPDSLTGDAARAARQTLRRISCSEYSGPEPFADAEVIVDAILGTGLDRELGGRYLQVVRDINDAGRPVLSIDLPTGLHADSGRIMGVAVRADITITFVGLKQGLFTGQGADCCGRIVFADLAVPPEIYQAILPDARRIDYETTAGWLAPRPRSSHKGLFGHVLVLGGDHGFSGAVRMAAQASARCGAGLVSIATRSAHAWTIPLAVPELMVSGVENISELDPLLSRASVILAGPGMGQSPWAQAMLARTLECRLPLVLDADALNLLAREPAYSDWWILTPHPGEAARLLGISTAEIQADRFRAAGRLQQRYGGIIVLKGSGTLVFGPDTLPLVCTAGNPGMATGGMGDVLSGVVAGLLAQGLSPLQAAALGVTIHAMAGDSAARQGGERGLMATDLLPWISRYANPGMNIAADGTTPHDVEPS